MSSWVCHLPRARSVRAFATALSLALASYAPSLARGQEPVYDLAAVQAQFADNLDIYGPGLCVRIEQRGRVLLDYRTGLLGSRTKIAIASCTKWLSGAIVAILAERGHFDLDDPVGQHLPAFEAAGKGAPTIRQCFAMNSGFYLTQPDYEIDSSLTLAESVDLIAAHTPIVFPPGTQLAYEGDGMQIVGRICEVVTGQSWQTLADELLFDPLGMDDTSYDLFDLNPGIAGGVHSTQEDYLKFLRMLLAGGLAPDGRVVMSARTVNEFFRNQTWGLPEYASPWPDIDYDVYGHRGDYGLGSWILAQPDAASPVEEITSPGAFGSLPWIDRRRGVIGMVCTLTLGGSPAHQNTLLALTHLRAEIDAKGLPSPGDPGPVLLSWATAVRPGAPDYLHVDWTGGGTLETSADLLHWTAWPLVGPPFLENLTASPAPGPRHFYRVRR